MTLNSRAVTATYAVHGQLQPEDMAHAKAQGFKSIINNRPDGEEPGQPTSQALAQAALAAGLHYAHIPVAGPIAPKQRQAMQAELARLPQPVLAFCRSGARSTRIWAHAMHDKQPTATLLAAAAQAGCDVAALQAELEQHTRNPHE